MRLRLLAIPALLAVSIFLAATETENHGLLVMPVPGVVTVDGTFADWDLSGGNFACNDCENQRGQYAAWIHAMADADNLYILTRWIDATPLNNAGQTIANYGWDGDCLQIRLLFNQGTPQQQKTVVNCWKGADGADVLQFDVEGKPWGPAGKDMKGAGAKQAFHVDADGKGYSQEIALPWKLLTADGVAPKPGAGFITTMEPNFSVGHGRLSLKDCFRPGVNIDRVFTFMADKCWGEAVVQAHGKQAPRAVRLSDAREFPVHLVDGKPEIDWSGLVKTSERPGFVPVAFSMPEDGYVSLNIMDAQGMVVRQLLTADFFAKGPHTVQWDGLTTPNWRQPGEPVAAGTYRFEAIRHDGVHLALRGWAANAGSAPWDSSPTANWGGDHGMPDACLATDDGVLLGWSGAEAGKAVVACDLQGQVRWRNSRNGMAGAELFASGPAGLYVMNWKGNLYRLSAKDGVHQAWEGTTSTDLWVKDLWSQDEKVKPEEANAMTIAGDRLLLGFAKENLVAALDARTGKLLGRFTVPAPLSLKSGADGTVYALVGGTSVLALDPLTGATRPVVSGLSAAVALAVDHAGDVYVGLGAPANQVTVFSAAGKPLRTIGRAGGRAMSGAWTKDGMAYIHDLTVDASGQLWVAEMDMLPKRFSVWNGKTGVFVRELFGPTTYGALGGVINPRDPLLMVGQGCEWRLDPVSGLASCLGVITHEGMENARFGSGTNGRLYLAVAPQWWSGDVLIFERLGDADFRLRTRIKAPTKEAKGITVWADANGDGLEQAGESHTTELDLNGWITGWAMPMASDLSFYGSAYQIRVTGYTACGAPEYDLTKAVRLPAPDDLSNRGGMGAQRGMGNPAAGRVLYNGVYNQVNSTFDCYDLASGKRAWSYPNNFTGVHGSHMAGAAASGLIRGAFDICGTANLPKPVGAMWAITTNFGEWHLLTEKGFYLARLFEPDPMRVAWPEKALPGVSLDRIPAGLGGEDFGGSMTQTTDGRIFVQAGKTGFWNIEVTGLDSVRALPGGTLRIAEGDLAKARGFREGYLQASLGTARVVVPHVTPTFTGKLDADFPGVTALSFRKQDDAAVRTACAWDGSNLFLAWQVTDHTPWVNGATDATQLYLSGDTVDFQLGTDPTAAAGRGEAAAGDLRLSIGNFQGKPTAMLYRKISAVKHPRTFSSGIVKSYAMDFVDRIEARITVTLDPGKGYLIEAAVPLTELGLTPGSAKTLHGDFGVTHGGASGDRTRLRTYWSNQHTGIVDDSVFELKLEPGYWGELQFTQ